jgi:phosphatidylinositol kinase/protein kinase (PI-3  family)
VHDVFKKARMKLWLKPYRILCTGPGSGVIETLIDAVSFNDVKVNY